MAKQDKDSQKIGELMDLAVNHEVALKSFQDQLKEAFGYLCQKCPPKQLYARFRILNRILNAGKDLGYCEVTSFDISRVGPSSGGCWHFNSPDRAFLDVFEKMRIIGNTFECYRLLWDALVAKGLDAEKHLAFYREHVEGHRTRKKASARKTAVMTGG